LKIKPIAIVLPQFHPVPENNQWWGEGFTEWTNVVKGKPLFKGHYQPHLPKNLGYYDLRLAETREAQAALAKKYGIYGFCYYHYWFNGRRILETPVDAILESGTPDFPFMLCWANENWTRNWDGGFNEVLVEQKHFIEDFVAHAHHLVKYFQDKRYIRINNKPVFAIYKDLLIEDIDVCINAFRDTLKGYGLEVFLCRFEHDLGTTSDFTKAYSIFDAGIEFQPFTRHFSILKSLSSASLKKYLTISNYYRWIKKTARIPINPKNIIIQYKDLVNHDLAYDFQTGFPIFPGVCPGWDNSVRRQNGGALIINDSTPELFESWVFKKIKKTHWDLLPERFIFVNAWNEWAEGNHLEPCECWGVEYLNAIKKALNYDV
jgi:lipopolysaccharide biosynthesis protein